jgi:hypothetical protein
MAAKQPHEQKMRLCHRRHNRLPWLCRRRTVYRANAHYFSPKNRFPVRFDLVDAGYFAQ